MVLQEQNLTQDTAQESSGINVLDVLWYLVHKAWILLLSLLVGVGIAGAYTHYLVTPMYQTYSIIYVLTKSTSITSLTDLQLSTNLTEDYRTLATTRSVVEEVIAQLGLNTSYEALVKNISVENPADTRYLYIYAESPDPELAANISNKMAEVLRNRISAVMLTDAPSMVEQAVVPRSPHEPSMVKNVAIGGLLGLWLAVGVLLVRYFMDDTYKTPEDISYYLGINTLATISKQRDSSKDKEKKRKQKAEK